MNGSNPPSLQLVNNATSSPSNVESCPIEPQHLSITVFLCFVFLGGFLLNGFSLWVFCCRISKWSSGNILQFHLAMSDAIIAPAAPLIGVYFAMGQWTLGPFLCQLKIALITIHFYGSILFLMLISIHRYVAVVHYKKSTPMQQTKFVHKLCGGVWLLLLTSGSATFVLFHDSQVGNHTLCLSVHQSEYITTYFTINFFLVALGFLVPFLVLVVCYTSLVNSVSRIKTNTAKGQAMKSKSCKMVAMCLVIFAVCFMPLSVVRSVCLVVKMFFPSYCTVLLHLETAYYVSWILAGANCCLDPLLYCFGSKNFNKTMRRSLKIIPKKDVSNEQGQDSQDLTRVTHSTASV
ncbi:P2Y purinoceptor 2-like [Scleropages formosus]|uniref:P2Y purinoceptor 2-like n=1 Tax=Scleropages formosus TaxID=113540 RepID=A0A8C9V3G0_SCLFO|nr:P2Y purinoceptor 2-like [Scleropages formosus]XP_018614617.1 P2Y purinoceptor 2-like [Scleropages formosus]XP_018614619.1 P2Y purinoceptor 2-like [Scleropages formosus]XP_018614620.1 P2Y purinoceptor 2-like [Scleropages formosus]